MIENHGSFQTTDEYWDCNCGKDYIHPVAEWRCRFCGCSRGGSPNSRVVEVLKFGFEIKDMTVRGGKYGDKD